MVPPVARIVTFGFLPCAVASCRLATRAAIISTIRRCLNEFIFPLLLTALQRCLPDRSQRRAHPRDRFGTPPFGGLHTALGFPHADRVRPDAYFVFRYAFLSRLDSLTRSRRSSIFFSVKTFFSRTTSRIPFPLLYASSASSVALSYPTTGFSAVTMPTVVSI